MKKPVFYFSVVVCSCLGCQEGGEFSLGVETLDVQTSPLKELDIHIDQEIIKCMSGDIACNGKRDFSIVFDDSPEEDIIEDLSFEVVEGVKYLNNKKLTDKEEADLYRKLNIHRANTLKKIVDKRKLIIDELHSLDIKMDEERIQEYIDGNDALHVELSVEDIKKISRSKYVLGIELFDPPVDTSLATAMLATYVTQGASFQYNRGGEKIGIYMSESGCPGTGYIQNYTLISGATSVHSRNVSAIIRAVSPNSHIYCKSGCVLPGTGMIQQGAQGNNPDIFFANFSCGSNGNGTYASSSKYYDDIIYNTGLTIMNAAGNEGNNEGYVSSQALGMNVIAVGNYNDYSNTPENFTINSSSSYKNATNTKSSKPEVSAPGTSINAGTYESGGSITDPVQKKLTHFS